ncbi:MAG: 50S ribosomal protein L30e [Candidatus Altiarchaeales archaeon HGW-Altiarchaeales-3]|nr:MAG: 50S ribosomal protein L30e [Candidatus Altiarchaeales archaeon HGW-Altiarchaeales-3]
MKEFKQKLNTAIRTGKLVFGSKNVIKLLLNGTSKLIVLSNNCPDDVTEKINYYCRLAEVPCYTSKMDGIELGAASGKPFTVSALAVIKEGDSTIMDVAS